MCDGFVLCDDVCLSFVLGKFLSLAMSEEGRGVVFLAVDWMGPVWEGLYGSDPDSSVVDWSKARNMCTR